MIVQVQLGRVRDAIRMVKFKSPLYTVVTMFCRAVYLEQVDNGMTLGVHNNDEYSLSPCVLKMLEEYLEKWVLPRDRDAFRHMACNMVEVFGGLCRVPGETAPWIYAADVVQTPLWPEDIESWPCRTFNDALLYSQQAFGFTLIVILHPDGALAERASDKFLSDDAFRGAEPLDKDERIVAGKVIVASKIPDFLYHKGRISPREYFQRKNLHVRLISVIPGKEFGYPSKRDVGRLFKEKNSIAVRFTNSCDACYAVNIENSASIQQVAKETENASWSAIL